MRFLFLFLVFLQFLYSNDVKKVDDNKTINDLYQLVEKKNVSLADVESLLNELNRIQLTNKIIDVNNIAMDVDTDNKVLNEKIELLKSQIEFVLAEQQKRFESLSENQRQMYETEILLLWKYFALIGFAITVIIALLSLFGYSRIKKKINKTVSDEIIKNHKKETKKLIQSLANEKDFIELIKAEIDNIEMDEGEGGDGNRFDGGTK
jgi:septal ring factor EnvC (AmiA/AmiB activator)